MPRPAPTLNRSILLAIGRGLQAHFDAVIQPGLLPPRLVDLMQRLKARLGEQA